MACICCSPCRCSDGSVFPTRLCGLGPYRQNSCAMPSNASYVKGTLTTSTSGGPIYSNPAKGPYSFNLWNKCFQDPCSIVFNGTYVADMTPAADCASVAPQEDWGTYGSPYVDYTVHFCETVEFPYGTKNADWNWRSTPIRVTNNNTNGRLAIKWFGSPSAGYGPRVQADITFASAEYTFALTKWISSTPYFYDNRFDKSSTVSNTGTSKDIHDYTWQNNYSATINHRPGDPVLCPYDKKNFVYTFSATSISYQIDPPSPWDWSYCDWANSKVDLEIV